MDKKRKKSILKYIIIIALTGMFGTLFFNLGIKYSDVSLVAAITFASPLVSTLYGKFVYKEKLKPQQWAAIALILVGIITISYF